MAEWTYRSTNARTGESATIRVEALINKLVSLFPDELSEFVEDSRLPTLPEDPVRGGNVYGSLIAENNFTPTQFARPSLNFEEKVKVATFTRKGPEKNLQVDVPSGTIKVKKAGTYAVRVSMVVTGLFTDRISVAVFKGDTQVGPRATRNVSGSGLAGSLSIDAHGSFNKGDEISLEIQNETGVNAVTVEECTLAISRL